MFWAHYQVLHPGAPRVHRMIRLREETGEAALSEFLKVGCTECPYLKYKYSVEKGIWSRSHTFQKFRIRQNRVRVFISLNYRASSHILATKVGTMASMVGRWRVRLPLPLPMITEVAEDSYRLQCYTLQL